MEFFDDICISDITVISGVRPSGRSTNNLAGRRNNGLLYIRSGEAQFWEKSGQSIIAKEDELIYIPKGCCYKMQYTADETSFVLVDLEITDKSGKDVLLAKSIALLASDDISHRISGIMSGLDICGGIKNLSALFRRKELVYKLLSAVYESNPMPSVKAPKYPQILEGVRLLEQTYLENIPVSRFAEASNVSISLFRTLFSKQYGMSPVQYRNRLRIDRAAVILSEGSSTVFEAAYACGFENIGYFCRYYKKITGETPGETKLRNQ